MFNIENKPLTNDELANLRIEHTLIYKEELKKEKIFFLGWCALSIIVLVQSLYIIYSANDISFVSYTTKKLFEMFFISWVLTFISNAYSIDKLAVNVNNVIYVLCAGFSNLSIGLYFYSLVGITYGLEPVYIIPYIPALIITLVFKKYYTHKIFKRKLNSDQLLKNLIELKESKHGRKCVRFVNWCHEDSIVLNFQHQLSMINRNPVMGEYESAYKWMKDKPARDEKLQEIEEIKTACLALKKPIDMQRC